MFPVSSTPLSASPVPLFHLAAALLCCAAVLVSGVASAQSPIYFLNGDKTGDNMGYALAGAGDVNLDGYDDVLASVPGWDDPNGAKSGVGRVYLVSGKYGTVLLTMDGEEVIDGLGISVGSAGDVNQDGYLDVMVGTPYWNDPNGPKADKGRVYVRSGKDGTLLFLVQGEHATDNLGRSVAGADDVNQDGYDDLVLGAHQWDDPNASDLYLGRTYVVSGKDQTLLHVLDGEGHLDQSGWSVAGAGDVNLDAYPDVSVSAPGWNDPNGPKADSGRVYVYSGKDGAVLATLNGETAGDSFGYSLCGASDVDLDSYPDLLASSVYWNDPNGPKADCGRAYVYSGKDGSALFTWNGEKALDLFGQSVGSAGDADQDGPPDFLVGANLWDNTGGGSNHGRAYLYSGKDGSLFLTRNGEKGSDFLGWSVAGAGDVNDDGYPDQMAGAPYRDDPVGPKTDSGRGYLFSYVNLPLTSDSHLLSIGKASTQNLALDAGAVHAGRSYWVFGNFAVNGTSPGVTLGSVNIPLNPDPWTQLTIDFANSAVLSMTKGALDGAGKASASLNSLSAHPTAPLDVTFQHCYLVYTSGVSQLYYMASNLVPWTTVP